MPNPEIDANDLPQDQPQMGGQPDAVEVGSIQSPEKELPEEEDEAAKTLDEFTQGIDGSKFASFDDLLEYVVLLNDLPDVKEDMEKSRYDLRNTRFMRSLKIFTEFLNSKNWFAIWEDGEVYPLAHISDEKKVKFDPKTKRPAFNEEWFDTLYDAVLKFFTAAPGLSEDFAPQHGPNAGKVTKSGNRTKYIKQHLGQVERIAANRGKERAFNKVVSWLYNIYLAGTGSGTSRFEYQDPYKYLYDSKKEAEGLYIYESREEAISSIIGSNVSHLTMRQIFESHKKSIWLGLIEGYNDLPSEIDPREEPKSGYGVVEDPYEFNSDDLPPKAKFDRPDIAPVNQFLDGQACENCGCNPCGCEGPAADPAAKMEVPAASVSFSVAPDAQDQSEFGPCPVCGASQCGCVSEFDEDMSMGNEPFFQDDEMEECMEDIQSTKTTEIKGSDNETDELGSVNPKLKGGVSTSGGSKGLEGGKKPAPKPPASV